MSQSRQGTRGGFSPLCTTRAEPLFDANLPKKGADLKGLLSEPKPGLFVCRFDCGKGGERCSHVPASEWLLAVNIPFCGSLADQGQRPLGNLWRVSPDSPAVANPSYSDKSPGASGRPA